MLANRVGWALPGMEHARLVERVRLAVCWLTDEGGRLSGTGPGTPSHSRTGFGNRSWGLTGRYFLTQGPTSSQHPRQNLFN